MRRWEGRTKIILLFYGVFLSKNLWVLHSALVSGFAHFSLAEKFPDQICLLTVASNKLGKQQPTGAQPTAKTCRQGQRSGTILVCAEGHRILNAHIKTHKPLILHSYPTVTPTPTTELWCLRTGRDDGYPCFCHRGPRCCSKCSASAPHPSSCWLNPHHNQWLCVGSTVLVL